MKPLATTARRLWPALAVATILLGLGDGPARIAWAQLPTSEERLKILTDPEDIKKKLEKEREKSRPPIEMFRSSIAPFDILPFVKANHWSTINLELRSNYNDYAGSLQTSPVPLVGLPLEMVFRRDARMPKTQRMRLGLQMLLPKIPEPPHAEINLELIRPEAVRADEIWPAPLRNLRPHQMVVMVLAGGNNDAYATWNRFQAFYPQSVERDDALALEKLRYYVLARPLDPDKPVLSSHPLTWTTISHVVWDGLKPEILNPSQQQAMLDWLHWGGQLTIVGGAGPAFSLLNDSFLSPYLPADLTGENALLSREDLTPLSAAYCPLITTTQNEVEDLESQHFARASSRGYRRPVAINPRPNQPLYLTGLKPRPGATEIGLGESGDRVLGVEWRVGRGRVLMLGISPTDPAMVVWPGLDTFVRRVILRRPEDGHAARNVRGRVRPAQNAFLNGRELSWVRYLSRDTEIEEPTPSEPAAQPTATPEALERPVVVKEDEPVPEEDVQSPNQPVAAWIDTTGLPRFCRHALEEASGIKIPSALFVFKVVVAYIFALVPLNWLICRYVFRRRELAWIIVPLLSLGFAFGVERAAVYDMGYNSAADEIDIVEAFGGYPRAHVSRFTSLYSTGRTRYSISFPNDPTALALPLDTGRTLRGEDISTAVWQSYPVPALEELLVQPRSLAIVRTEEMVTLDGTIELTTDENGERSIVNAGGFELRDAVVVDVSGEGDRREIPIGTIPPGGTVPIKAVGRPKDEPAQAEALNPQRLLEILRESEEFRPENQGEIRLVAWTSQALKGQQVEPPVDRHRGFTAFVVHLRLGPPPSPDGPLYNDLASAAVSPEPEPVPANVRPRIRRQQTRVVPD